MKLPKTMLTGLIVMAALIAMAQSGLAQTAASGALTGTITDTNRALIAGVKVTVTNEAIGESRTVGAGPDGQYRAPLLPPGAYRIEASRSGFKTATPSGLPVVVTSPRGIAVVLIEPHPSLMSQALSVVHTHYPFRQKKVVPVTVFGGRSRNL